MVIRSCTCNVFEFFTKENETCPRCGEKLLSGTFKEKIKLQSDEYLIFLVNGFKDCFFSDNHREWVKDELRRRLDSGVLVQSLKLEVLIF